MKKILLLLLATVLSMSVSAQFVTQNQPLPKPGETNHTAINAPRADHGKMMKAAAPKAAGTVVTPPESLETQQYRMNGYI